jgi:hypothetical protein
MQIGMRYLLENKIPVIVRKEILQSEEDADGYVIALEFYPESVPTFTFISKSGHIFAYLPPHAFGFGAERELTDLVDVECPQSKPSICDLKIQEEGFGKVNERLLAWKTYICSIDWAEENILIHCVQLYDGVFAFLRNSRFQIGGTNWNPPKWKKLRKEWKLNS